MTTIAYKGATIAYDSLATCGDLVFDDDFDKHIEVDGTHFFLAGAPAHFDKVIENYMADKVIHEIEWRFLAVKGARVFDCLADAKEGLFYKTLIRAGQHWAIGSGADHALTAMDMGAHAFAAVEMAAKRDVGTGGRIRTFDL